jgi:hypothetical protein
MGAGITGNSTRHNRPNVVMAGFTTNRWWAGSIHMTEVLVRAFGGSPLMAAAPSGQPPPAPRWDRSLRWGGPHRLQGHLSWERAPHVAGCQLDVERISDPGLPEAEAAPTAMPKTSMDFCPDGRGCPLLAVDRPHLRCDRSSSHEVPSRTDAGWEAD